MAFFNTLHENDLYPVLNYIPCYTAPQALIYLPNTCVISCNITFIQHTYMANDGVFIAKLITVENTMMFANDTLSAFMNDISMM